MDIVYCLGSGSMCGDEELRYSLRSVEKHLKNVDRVFVVGAKPEFLSGEVIHIIHPDQNGEGGLKKAENVKNKLLRACSEKKLSSEFLFMADDHFINQELDAKKFPFYTQGNLPDVAEAVRRQSRFSNYLKTYTNTIAALEKRALTLTDFNVHTPIRYNKKKFVAAMDEFSEWSTSKWGLLIKSLYCNWMNVTETQVVQDVKIGAPFPEEKIKEIISGKPIFSVSDRGMMVGHRRHAPMFRVLNELYPNKSRFEK